ncbi:MAG: YciI family protein [Gammaproteobacteria bacterium]|nr:YciI family protein [Gammaproteobacteria bacterium]
MLYAILCDDTPGSLESRRRLRPAHVERLRVLQREGRLITAGPLPAIDAEDPGPAGFTGNLIVAEFESQEAALAWAEADPFRQGGIYGHVTVRPYKKVFPE